MQKTKPPYTSSTPTRRYYFISNEKCWTGSSRREGGYVGLSATEPRREASSASPAQTMSSKASSLFIYEAKRRSVRAGGLAVGRTDGRTAKG